MQEFKKFTEEVKEKLLSQLKSQEVQELIKKIKGEENGKISRYAWGDRPNWATPLGTPPGANNWQHQRMPHRVVHLVHVSGG